MQAAISAHDDRTVPVRPMAYEDPIGTDGIGDSVVIKTVRSLCRIAMIAAQIAIRFRDEGSPHDPVAWMLAPRRLYDGDNALHACLERRAFMRTMLLHGLALGLDAVPGDFDHLFDQVDDGGTADAALVHDRGRPDDAARLYTATVVFHGEGTMLHAFHASVACSGAEIAARLQARYGAAVSAVALTTEGFDTAERFAQALLAPAIGKVLSDVGRNPTSRVAAGLDLNFEQRLDA